MRNDSREDLGEVALRGKPHSSGARSAGSEAEIEMTGPEAAAEDAMTSFDPKLGV